MDLALLKNCVKARFRNLLIKITPYTHFIPKRLRNWVSDKLFRATENRIAIPAPYQPGAFEGGVNLFGLFKAEIGLAQGLKLYASALEKSGVPHTFLNTNFLSWLPQKDTAFDSRLSARPRYAINLVHINPDQWIQACGMFPQKAFDGHYNIGVWLWELEDIPEKWHDTFPYVNELWAPSRFIADALKKVSPVPVTFIPYGMDVPVAEGLFRSDFDLPENKFLVLAMYDSNSFMSRKNPMAAVEAFHQAFGDKPEKAHLVLKINNPTEHDLAALRGVFGSDDTYTLITGTMPKPRLNALIRLCDVFISLHRSEGFGLVMAEAMALGRPVVATNWSANVEFMPGNAACMVDYDLIPVDNAYQWGQAGQRWADAHVDHAAEYLRRLADDPDYYERISLNGQRFIREHYSVEHTAALIKARVGEILAGQ